MKKQSFLVLYLFSGKHRDINVRSFLEAWSKDCSEFEVQVEEWDIANGISFDLLKEDVRSSLLERINNGEFLAIVLSPPCGTWSRAPWANQFGPRPLRSAAFPWGFPWLEGSRLVKASDSNVFIQFCIAAINVVVKRGLSTAFLLEHPENLGAVTTYRKKAQAQWFSKSHKTVRPASIWQLEEIYRLVQHEQVFTMAFHQCHFGASSPKPTRILSSLKGLSKVGPCKWPQLATDGSYCGPLPRQCGCGRLHDPLIAKDSSGAFNTTAAAAYPPAMDEWIAAAIWSEASKSLLLKRPRGKGLEGLEECKDKENKDESLEKDEQENQSFAEVNKDVAKEAPALPSPVPPSKRDLKRKWADTKMANFARHAPLQVWYKGKMRRAVDGLGKTSPGVRPAGSRGPHSSNAASTLAGAFWKEVGDLVGSMSKEERLRMVAKLALGKFTESPFEAQIKGIRQRLDDLVKGLGKDPGRKKGDRDVEINVRRLKAWAELSGDEDFVYLGALASRGVPLGVRGEIGRVPSIYDPKSKNEEDSIPAGWDEDMVQTDRDNYASAKSHLELVKSHIEEDVKKGWIIKMSKEEASRRFGDELQIASLGAVPKDVAWSDVRVVHDGTHGIQVNTKIQQPNKMEFPQFDDLQAFMRSFQLREPQERMLFAFDIRSAHRLVPVQPEDWGLQAFRLEEDGDVYCNTRGTFGVASASFWWGRLAATLFRTFHRVLPREALIYLMLFADDGLALVGGEQYHHLAVALFVYLEVMEVPLSWRKTRGGFRTEWIGYTVDLDTWQIGVSEKKVAWLTQWVQATNLEGRILGRDFRSGVGRLGFLAGAIKGARPFLAPLYATAARVGPTSFVELHMMVRLSLEFFAKWLQEEPMRSLQDPPGVAGEVFRVDAMGSEQGIRVGGWETYHSTNPKECRWFSVELTRSNCPWLYVRGEPHRTIAASELLAVTLAVILFAPAARWREKHGRLVLSGFTDNASNTYVVDKYLSVKFPVSMVLMELSRQLSLLGSELQLHWIPREQNEESDDLSKERFDKFAMDHRIDVDFDLLPLKVIPTLMEHAMQFDEEIKLKKGSKEGKKSDTPKAPQRTPAEEKLRLKQPW